MQVVEIQQVTIIDARRLVLSNIFTNFTHPITHRKMEKMNLFFEHEKVGLDVMFRTWRMYFFHAVVPGAYGFHFPLSSHGFVLVNKSIYYNV